MTSKLAVAVLAAGKGTRMKSTLPKVLHPLGGRSLVECALDSLATVNPAQQMNIIGYAANTDKTALAHRPHLTFEE
ncbi:MAG: NTP transferase domain-containing protein, partial [Leptolyngbyaceae cyanobacterium]